MRLEGLEALVEEALTLTRRNFPKALLFRMIVTTSLESIARIEREAEQQRFLH